MNRKTKNSTNVTTLIAVGMVFLIGMFIMQCNINEEPTVNNTKVQSYQSNYVPILFTLDLPKSISPNQQKIAGDTQNTRLSGEEDGYCTTGLQSFAYDELKNMVGHLETEKKNVLLELMIIDQVMDKADLLSKANASSESRTFLASNMFTIDWTDEMDKLMDHVYYGIPEDIEQPEVTLREEITMIYGEDWQENLEELVIPECQECGTLQEEIAMIYGEDWESLLDKPMAEINETIYEQPEENLGMPTSYPNPPICFAILNNDPDGYDYSLSYNWDDTTTVDCQDDFTSVVKWTADQKKVFYREAISDTELDNAEFLVQFEYDENNGVMKSIYSDQMDGFSNYSSSNIKRCPNTPVAEKCILIDAVYEFKGTDFGLAWDDSTQTFETSSSSFELEDTYSFEGKADITGGYVKTKQSTKIPEQGYDTYEFKESFDSKGCVIGSSYLNETTDEWMAWDGYDEIEPPMDPVVENRIEISLEGFTSDPNWPDGSEPHPFYEFIIVVQGGNPNTNEDQIGFGNGFWDEATGTLLVDFIDYFGEEEDLENAELYIGIADENTFEIVYTSNFLNLRF